MHLQPKFVTSGSVFCTLHNTLLFLREERPFDKCGGGGGGRRLPTKQTVFPDIPEKQTFFPNIIIFFCKLPVRKKLLFSTKYRKLSFFSDNSAVHPINIKWPLPKKLYLKVWQWDKNHCFTMNRERRYRLYL